MKVIQKRQYSAIYWGGENRKEVSEWLKLKIPHPTYFSDDGELCITSGHGFLKFKTPCYIVLDGVGQVALEMLKAYSPDDFSKRFMVLEED
ncbi:MAG: hypothetical protein LBQ81_08235 [Zoogloeaceae bacterium]|jgi:hypothetical protein|nr:hypothetical protein [Zoogloeaceae bacterium]